jgi:hypothetical protein
MKTLTRALPTALIAAACLGAPAIASASCGAAFCTVNTNWTAESAMVDAGSSFDLRYEVINQNQPRAGSDKIAVGQISHHHDEVRTLNRNLIATYSHSFASGWGVSVSAPLTYRNHAHIHNHRGAKINDDWEFTELGDVRVIGRYQLPFVGRPDRPATTGLTAGLKLPTGDTDVGNPANGAAERSLQPGTGTTDLILGAYHHQRLPSADASWFTQAQYQRALNTHANYRPGAQFSLDAGYRHGFSDSLAGLLQVNMLFKGRDSGSEAEPADSGGRYLHLSPGLSYAVSENMQLYGFVQVPLYQHVNGVQLTASRGLVAGISGRF